MNQYEEAAIRSFNQVVYFPWVVLWYSAIFMSWAMIVVPLMAVLWTLQLIGWAILLHRSRSFDWPALTPVIGLEWIRSFEHPSHARRREQRRRDFAAIKAALR
jgi:hypothetical protein